MEKKQFLPFEEEKTGIKIGHLSLIIAIATVAISALLLIGTYLSFNNYGKLIGVSHSHLEWQETAHKMSEGSDTLTEKVRDFAETGNRDFVDEYFTEATTDRTRETALENIRRDFPDSNIYNSLERAMDESVALMRTEYYSMRLKVEAMGYDVTDYPQEIQDVVLSTEDAALDSEGKAAKARAILFDDNYLGAKRQIANDTNTCIKLLYAELEAKQSAVELSMRFLFIFEIVMVGAFITFEIVIGIITSKQVFTPIINSIPVISSERPMPVEGAHELRLLAETYNKMYNANHKEKNSLEFKTEHDELTGVMNRRALSKLQETTGGEKLAFLMIDIDNFKHINDTQGHLVGDEVLKNVVSHLRLYMRASDKIFRIGGDEFAIVMLGVDESSRDAIKKKIDSVNKALHDEKPENFPNITLSVGVAFGNVINQDLISRADDALYERKLAGKAGISFYSEKM